MKVNWDYYSSHMERIQKKVPNHQPDTVLVNPCWENSRQVLANGFLNISLSLSLSLFPWVTIVYDYGNGRGFPFEDAYFLLPSFFGDSLEIQAA